MSVLTNCLCALVVFAETAQGPPPTFVARTEAVRLDVSVVDDGGPVLGLGVADFRVVDDGVVQQVEHVFTDEEPVYAWLLFDRSQSSAGDVWPHLRQAAERFIDALGPRDRACALAFGDTLTLAATPEDGRARAWQSLEALRPVGNTRFFDGVYSATVLARSSGRRTVLIAFTDGRDNASWISESELKSALDRAETVLYSVTVQNGAGVGPTRAAERSWEAAARRPATKLLRRLTSDTGGEAYTVRSATALHDVYGIIARRVKSRYVLTYIPQNVPARGWHQVHVTRIGGPGEVHTRRQYWSDGQAAR